MLDKYMQAMPQQAYAMDFNTVHIVRYLFQLEKQQEALVLSKALHENATELLDYYLRGENTTDRLEINRHLYVLNVLAESLQAYQPELAEKVKQDFIQFYARLEGSL
ncbi:hypothetical protein OKW21_004891 [Catalinimonas alkaloidigena]|uniref:hypothetical protein n=1 Tax=Catalinimonas alkaloidigena TaxID=1075417 RepID=UPI002404BB79|nr:hypothetical protein [Catalinimonas alkaloidigena]MDF9799628.1 hypothetical protein [Catalinimonas alkaloidigena]